MKYLIILTLILAGCSSGGGSDSEPAPKEAPTIKSILVFGDSLSAEKNSDSWVSLLRDDYIINNKSIPGYRATYSYFSDIEIKEDIFIIFLGTNDATGITQTQETMEGMGLSSQTYEDFEEAYKHHVGRALLSGAEVICVLPPLTTAPWVYPAMPRIWQIINEICIGVASIAVAVDSDSQDGIHYTEYGHDLNYQRIKSYL